MQELHDFQKYIIAQIKNDLRRFLHHQVEWKHRMIAIKGPRGSGKTTMMLQRLQFDIDAPPDKKLYVTADHHWFYTHRLIELAESFYRRGGRFLFIDEVHKYPAWSTELKNIYDGFPDMHVVFSSSSALDIYRGEADLSRRVFTYMLPGLSFREYIKFGLDIDLEPLTLEQILSDGDSYLNHIAARISIYQYFDDYLKRGYLPLFMNHTQAEIAQLLQQVINHTLESDLSTIAHYTPGTVQKIKKLLGVIAESAPFKPNIAALSRKIDVSRDSLYSWLTHMHQAGLINLMMAQTKGVAVLQKPEKIYLENTNFCNALQAEPNKGSVRETFVLNQLLNANYHVRAAKHCDFFVNNTWHIEVGGRGKQIGKYAEADEIFFALDDMATRIGNSIPIWQFGFLY